MSGPSACPIVLSMPEQQRLERRVRTVTEQHRHVLRATIILLAAQGWSNAAIARRVGVCVDTARTWRDRYGAYGEDGLRDRGRSGRPRRFTDVQQAQVKAIACELPADRGIPLSRFSHAESGCRSRRRRGGRGHLGIHRAPVATPGCDPPVAPPVMDLPA